jgi:hypothetical protein
MFQQVHDFLVSLPNVTIQPHFDKISYRIGSKIIATFDEKTFQYCVKLTLEKQESYSILFPEVVFAVPNKWGASGWTFVDSEIISVDDLKEILHSAYRELSKNKRNTKS